MARRFLLLPRLYGGKHALPRAAGLVLLGVLSVLGVRAYFQGAGNARSVPAPPSGPDSLGVVDPGAFQRMRPRPEDKMALPRVGFRWSYVPDSARATVPSKQVRFRVHLISSDGAHEITQSVADSRTHVNLRDNFPTGKCEWWVEALVPGYPPVRSSTGTFELEP